jgi:hypothetical protein
MRQPWITGHYGGQIGQDRRHYLPPRELVHKAATGGHTAIEALAAKLEKNLAQAILSALTAQKEALDLDAIAAALEAGNIGQVLALLDLPASLAKLDTITPAIQDGVYLSGTAAAAGIARATGVQFVFGRLNPRLLTWLQTYSLGLIRQINTTTKEGIRQFLLTGMKAGDNPKVVARQVKGIIGLTDRQAKAVQNYRRQLESFHERRSAAAFGLGNKVNRVNGTQVTILDADGNNSDGIDQRRLRDYRYDSQMQRAMQTGKPLSPAQINKMVDAYERKYLAYRSRTIARTEATRANNVGVQDAWHQAIESGVASEDLVRKQWIVAKDERLCAVCGPIPKMNPKKGVKHGQSFMTPNGPTSLPPIHPNCRCSVFYRLFEPVQLQDSP